MRRAHTERKARISPRSRLTTMVLFPGRSTFWNLLLDVSQYRLVFLEEFLESFLDYSDVSVHFLPRRSAVLLCIIGVLAITVVVCLQSIQFTKQPNLLQGSGQDHDLLRRTHHGRGFDVELELLDRGLGQRRRKWSRSAAIVTTTAAAGFFQCSCKDVLQSFDQSRRQRRDASWKPLTGVRKMVLGYIYRQSSLSCRLPPQNHRVRKEIAKNPPCKNLALGTASELACLRVPTSIFQHVVCVCISSSVVYLRRPLRRSSLNAADRRLRSMWSPT